MPWGGEGYIVSSYESTRVEVDGCVCVKVYGDFRQFVLLGGRTSDECINQILQLLRTKSWLELKRGTQERLGDGERSERSVGRRHFEILLVAALLVY